MKQIISILSISAIALMALSSCQKENEMLQEKPSAKTAIMTVNAGSTTTKTAINEVDSKNYTLTWTAGDAIACYEVGVDESVPTIQGKTTSTALESDTAEATFTIDLSGNTAEPNYSYIFVYPAAKYTKNTGDNPIYRAQIPENQTFSATSFDKNADILISRAITNQTTRPSSVSAEFERIGATALMNIKAPTTTEKIRSITFSTTEGNLNGYVKVYPLEGTHDTDIYSGGKSLTLTPASSTTYSGTIPVWFRLGEITLTDNFKVVVTTNQKIYTKTINLASASRTLEFHNAGLTKFNVNMESVDGVDNPSLDDGDYYIVAKSGDYYYAMSNETKSNGLDYVQLSDFNPAAETYISSDETLVWTISNDGDAITIESETGSYLTAASKKASIATTKKTYTIATGSDSGTLSLNSVDLDGYGLRLNVGNFFAFYNSATSASMIGDFYFMPKDPRPRVAAPTNVEASASGTTITVIWDDASDANIDHYLVTLSGAADDSQTVAIGEGCYEFTGLSDGTYSVAVEAVPSDAVNYLNSAPVVIEGLKVGAGPSDYSYTFTTKAWVSDPAGWTSDKDGSGTDTRGISVQKAETGAGATSPVSYTNVSHISITLSKSSKGVGSVAVKVGSTTVLTQSSFTTTATAYEADVENLTGKVSFEVTCSTSTIYVKDITITATGTSE